MAHLMDYGKAASLLKRYGIGSVEWKYVSSAQDAVKFARGRPITLKVLTEKALHKTKSGIIELNLKEQEDIERAYESLRKKAERLKPFKMLAQAMADKGVEIIIGGNVDQQFGKMILVGLGGIYVETFKDFALMACPISEAEAGMMIDQLKSKDVIAPDDATKRMLRALLVKASRLFEVSDLKELDLNPVIVRRGGYDVVDIRALQ